MTKHKIVVAITGASGAIYAKLLLDKLKTLHAQIEAVGVIMSDNAKYVWETEIGDQSYRDYPFHFYSKSDFEAPFASGSAQYKQMVVVPCSMGTLARVASGVSNDLTTRAADVILKERRRLILVARETPLNAIHLDNMKKVTEAGAVVCPASPSFYAQPKTIEEAVSTVVDRIIDLLELENKSYRWGENS
ncbi:MAG: UbiX family flavin prenyltransferase [Vicingaceae bacterium]